MTFVYVLDILAPVAGVRPTEFRNNHVLHGRQEDVAVAMCSRPAAGKSFQIVCIVAQQEEFNRKRIIGQLQHVTPGGSNRLK